MRRYIAKFLFLFLCLLLSLLFFLFGGRLNRWGGLVDWQTMRYAMRYRTPFQVDGMEWQNDPDAKPADRPIREKSKTLATAAGQREINRD